MNSVNKQRAGRYLLSITVLLSLASLVLYCVNGSASYLSSYKGIDLTVILMSVLAIVFNVGILLAVRFAKANRAAKVLLDLGMILAVVFAGIALMVLVGDRVEPLAIVYGSELESDNQEAWSAMQGTVIAIALYLVSILVNLVSVFFSVREED